MIKNELVSIENGQVLTTSREIAEHFNKAHKDVLESIRNLTAENSAVKNMFIYSAYKNSRGRTYTEYLINRDGFSLLAMGFTGKDALEWKLKYIEAFNEMEKQLSSHSEPKLPVNYKEALVQLLVEVEKNEELEKENAVLKPKATYYDDVLKKNGLINTSIIAKDLGLHAAKLNEIMHVNRILFKNGNWYPYEEYKWLITDGYADYESYKEEKYKPVLKWTEKGRKWIIDNYKDWIEKYNSVSKK